MKRTTPAWISTFAPCTGKADAPTPLLGGHDYLKLLAKAHIKVSMSRSGNSYYHAMMESFFATLKSDCVNQRHASHDVAKQM